MGRKRIVEFKGRERKYGKEDGGMKKGKGISEYEEMDRESGRKHWESETR